MSVNVLLYEKSGGGVALVVISPRRSAATVARKAVPAGTPYWIIDRATLPDLDYFDAWELDAQALGAHSGIGGAAND
jgi:hypothetical protein